MIGPCNPTAVPSIQTDKSRGRSPLDQRAAASLSSLPRPFLRWAGSKRTHLPRLVNLIPDSYGTYWEPFLGGGSLFFLLQPMQAVLSDLCKPLISTYKAIRNNPKEVIAILDTLQVNRDTFYDVRSRSSRNPIEHAAHFIYLNKTCWNGLYRVNSSGRFNVPFGRPKSQGTFDADNILACSKLLRRCQVSIRNGDFKEHLAGVNSGDLVFLDPPYVTGHSNNGFIDYNERLFSWSDQERLAHTAQVLANRGATVIVTNAHHDEIHRLYQGFTSVILERKSTLASDMSKRGMVKEVAFYRTPAD